MSIPKFFEFFGPTLEQLSDGQTISINDLRFEVANKMNISQEDRQIMLPSGKQATYANRITWAVVYLKKAGLVSNPSRGKYVITQAGLKANKEVGHNINLAYLEKSEEFRDFRYGSEENSQPRTFIDRLDSSDDAVTPEDSMEKAYKEINAKLADELLNEIMEKSSYFFERLVVELLVRMGYGGAIEDAGIVTGRSSDEGIDGIIREDKLGFSNIYIQAKRWDPASSIGRPEIQRFVGALADPKASKGLFITTAQFSREAMAYARNKVVLVDGKTLAKLMIENNVGVSTINTYNIRKIDRDYFSDEDE